MKFSSTSNTSLQRCLYLLFRNQCPHFLPSLFSENYLNPHVKINKMVNKHTVGYHPSSSQLTSRIHPLIFLWTPKGFISPESFLNFFLNLYSTMIRKSFKFMMLRLLANTFVSQKTESVHFYSLAPSKTLPQFFIITPQTEGNYPFPPNSIFWRSIFPQEKAERIGLWSWKNYQNSTYEGVGIIHHLCNFSIFPSFIALLY